MSKQIKLYLSISKVHCHVYFIPLKLINVIVYAISTVLQQDLSSSSYYVQYQLQVLLIHFLIICSYSMFCFVWTGGSWRQPALRDCFYCPKSSHSGLPSEVSPQQQAPAQQRRTAAPLSSTATILTQLLLGLKLSRWGVRSEQSAPTQSWWRKIDCFTPNKW